MNERDPYENYLHLRAEGLELPGVGAPVVVERARARRRRRRAGAGAALGVAVLLGGTVVGQGLRPERQADEVASDRATEVASALDWTLVNVKEGLGSATDVNLNGFGGKSIRYFKDGVPMDYLGEGFSLSSVPVNMLERVEVLYGPASTLYGSDGLGGVLLFRTKAPQLSATGAMRAKGTGFVRYSTANEEKTGHADLSLGWKKFAWLQSYTYSDFGDMKMGSNYPDKYNVRNHEYK